MDSRKWSKISLWVMVIVLWASSISLADLSVGLVAHYPFNGNLEDESGNGFHLTAPSTYQFIAGPRGTGVHFDPYSVGSTNGGSTPEGPYVSTSGMNYPGPNGFTASFWGYVVENEVIGINDYWQHTASGQVFWLFANQGGNQIEFMLRDDFDDTPAPLQISSVPYNNQWVHVVGVYEPDGYKRKLYVNGELKAEDSLPGPMRTQLPPYFYVGGNWHETRDANIDEVRIYDRALTENEIYDLASLVVYYPFNGNLEDESGNGFHLTAPSTYQFIDGPRGTGVHFDPYSVGSTNWGPTPEGPYVSTSDMNYPGPNGFTASFWGYVVENEVIGINDYWQHTASGQVFWLFANQGGNQIEFMLRDDFDDTPAPLQISSVPYNNQWVHVVGVYEPDGYKRKLYVNGELKAEDNLPGPMRTQLPPYFYVAGNWHETRDASIDEVRIHDRALTATEISALGPQTYHVDAITGNDANDGKQRTSALQTIQQGISLAGDAADTILVWPGVYEEEVNFLGKAITVASAADAATITAVGSYAASFAADEGPDSVLEHFVLTGSYAGVQCVNASPTLRFLTVVDNDHGILADSNSDPDINHCILWGNANGDLFDCSASWSCLDVAHFVRVDEDFDSYPTGAAPPGWAILPIGGSNAICEVSNAVCHSPENSLHIAGDTTSGIDVGKSFDPVTAVIAECYMWNDNFDVEGAQFRLRGDAGTDCDVMFTVGGVWMGEREWIGITYQGAWYPMMKYKEKTWYYVRRELDLLENTGNVYIEEVGHPENSALHSFGNMVGNTYIDSVAFNTSQLVATNCYVDDVRVTIPAPPLDNGSFRAYPEFANSGNGDFHLKSARGRYMPVDPNEFGGQEGLWVLDEATSSCVDSGDPSIMPTAEPAPNGGRVNIGAYGETDYASRSEWLLSADLNRDGVVDLRDFALMGDQYLVALPWVP